MQLPSATSYGISTRQASMISNTKKRNIIRITDLASPQLNQMQQGAIDFFEQNPVTLTVDAVLSKAVKETGLSDFGAEDFKARLAIWLNAVDTNPNMYQLGRYSFFADCLRYAKARLRIEDVLKRHPEILEEKIVAPIIVVGLPRSGTTHLLNLISADTRLRSLPLWEAYEPVPATEEIGLEPGNDRRFQRVQEIWQAMDAMVPHVKAMHPMTPEHIHEEIELQGADFSSYIPEWISWVPEWRDYYYQHDQTPHYEYMLKVLKILQWQKPKERWVLKSPQHLEQLGPLMKVFPDASIVVTHRDPLSVIQSAATMYSYSSRLRERSIDPAKHFGYWADRIEHLLQASIRDRHLLPRGKTTDVFYNEFMKDDIGEVERIYAAADFELNLGARRQMINFADANKHGRNARVAYDMRADFGVEPDEIRERFSFYFNAFPVVREVE